MPSYFAHRRSPRTVVALAALVIALTSCVQQPAASETSTPVVTQEQPDQSGGDLATSLPSGATSESTSGATSESSASGSSNPSKSISPPDAAISEESLTVKNVTPEERAYIDEVGQEGVFEGAVLEAGQEACDKLKYLENVESGDIVGAIASDEVANATFAVEHLCPEFDDAKEEAEGGFGDGTYTVGTADDASSLEVEAGEYVSVGATEECKWTVQDATASIINEGGAGAMIIDGAAATIVSSGCYAWVKG